MSLGVIDKAGAWVFQTNYQQVRLAVDRGYGRGPETLFGWNFMKSDRWGLLDLDGRVVLDADFDQPFEHCADGRLFTYKNKEKLHFRPDGSPLQPPDGRLIDVVMWRQSALRVENRRQVRPALTPASTP